MTRVIVLGLDGVPYERVREFVDAGALPTFKKLFDQKQFHSLRTEVPPITAVGWPTIYTGKNPGRHGLYDFGPIDKNEMRVVRFHNPTDLNAEFVWEILERNGIKTGVVGVPMTSPFRKKPTFGEGDHLRPDWVNFDEWKNKDNYARVIHSHPSFEKRIQSMMDNKFDQLEFALEKKMKKEGVQFCALTVYVIDPLQHFRWHQPEVIREAYQLIDRRISRILEKLEKDDVLLVVADHGMTTQENIFYTNRWLEQRGYLVLKKKMEKKKIEKIAAKSPLNAQTFEKMTGPIINTLVRTNLMRFMPEKLAKVYNFIRKKLLPQKARSTISWEKIMQEADHERTKAYSAGCLGNIFINVTGREKNGSVPRAQVRRVAEKIRKDLVTDLKKMGLKAEVYLKEELYHGPELEHCFEIVPFIEGGKCITSSEYPFENIVVKKTDPKKDAQTATHDLHGVFAIAGKGVQGTTPKKQLTVRDITPTVLGLFGLDKETHDMDGRMLEEFFGEKREKKKARTEGTKKPATSEQEKIKDVLGNIQF